MGLSFKRRTALFLHRQVWQRLPKKTRRSAIEAAADLLAPRTAASPQPGQTVAVAGLLNASTGLGRSARLCEQALAKSGFATARIDLTQAMMAADSQTVASVASSIPEGPGTIIVHVNSPLLPLALLAIGRRRLKDKSVVGYWAWELPTAPPSWRRGVPYVHEIWVPSRFVAHSISPLTGSTPVLVVPHPVMVDEGDCRRADQVRMENVFTVLVAFDMSSGFSRKNPLAAIAAFRRAFGDDPRARLVIKAMRGETYPEGIRRVRAATDGHSNIVLDQRNLSRREFRALISAADVLLSLHRSEGYGLILAEAMAAGTCVVATDWSGNTDFLHERNSVPIGYRLVAADDKQGEYHYPDMMWADPNVDEAAAALRALFEDRSRREVLVEQARGDAERCMSVDAYMTALDKSSRLKRPS